MDDETGNGDSSAGRGDEEDRVDQVDRQLRKRAKRNAKRKEKSKARREERRVERAEAERMTDGKYELEDVEEAALSLEPFTATQELPVRLVGDPELAAEYARRLAAARRDRYMSYDTFRSLGRLIEADAVVLENSGRDWASTYQKLRHVEVLVRIDDDASFTSGDSGGWDDVDVKAMSD